MESGQCQRIAFHSWINVEERLHRSSSAVAEGGDRQGLPARVLAEEIGLMPVFWSWQTAPSRPDRIAGSSVRLGTMAAVAERAIRLLNRAVRPAKSQRAKRGQALKTKRTLTDGQRAYEARRAAKAGMSLDKWLDAKQRQQEIEARAKQRASEPAKPTKKPGLFSRLMERAHRPFGS